ncbi:MAG: cytochrome b [Sterolibacterium sp.]|nr:cytochrome b [Sterolibacterium sp.]
MNTNHAGPLRASKALRMLHWATVLAMALAWAFIYSKGLFDKGSFERNLLKELHMFAGLLVLVLLPLRILARHRQPLPPITHQPSRLVQGLATLMHVTLYVGLLVIPLLGMVYVQSKGQPLPVTGVQLPQLLSLEKVDAKNIKQLHEILGLFMLYLVILHAAAAFWHHRLLRDDTLRRML